MDAVEFSFQIPKYELNVPKFTVALVLTVKVEPRWKVTPLAVNCR
jgi:hypothetical protein